MSELKIEVLRREATGKGANRRLRAAGAIPAVVYGGELDSVPIQVDRKSLHELFRSGAGENAVFLLKLKGSKDRRPAMIRALDIDPLSRQIVHIDFQRINLSEKVRVEVSVELIGDPIGVIQEGGVLDFVNREVEVECLPGNIPPHLPIDVSGLHIGMHIEAKDLELPEGVELLEDPERVLVSLAHSRVAAEVEELEGEAAEEEELIEARRDEPEVIGKGKEPEEEPQD